MLQALEPSPTGAPIFLIDELDRTDEAFEAFLLEVLADSQVTIPELGTIKSDEPPITIITTNRTREIHDALKRRCLYHWVDYPNAERELQIVQTKLPEAAKILSEQVVAFVQKLRSDDALFKKPGVAETLDWATALTELHEVALDPEMVSDTLGVLLKYQEDIDRIKGSKTKPSLMRSVWRQTASPALLATCPCQQHSGEIPSCSIKPTCPQPQPRLMAE